MQILDVSIVQFIVPVAVVILCVFLVFALGFKSPGTPPVLEVREDDEKVQKTKKNAGKKSGKSTEARVKQTFVPPVLKQVNNVHGNVKATVSPVVAPLTVVTPPPVAVEKVVVVAEQPKPKVKKVNNKKVDENANISTLPEEVGDWTTAVSKKGRKKKDALAEVTNVPKQEIFAEEDVTATLGAEKLEQQNAEKKNGKKKKKSSPAVVEDKVEEEEVVVEESVAAVEESVVAVEESVAAVEESVAIEESVVAVAEKEDVVEDVVAVDDVVEEEVANDVANASEESRKKKQKKKNKKADKVVVEDVVVVEEPVVAVAVAPVEVVEVVESVEVDDGKMEVVKKKKKPESRKKFQEVPLAVTELEATNGDEVKVQQPAPPTSSKKNKKAKNEATKPARTSSTLPEADSIAFTSSNVELTSEEDGDWKQAKPIRRKKQVQREH